jgi:arginyl-tRNA synthetase
MFRSTLLGSFYCKINRLVGNEVIALNYLGDWGTQMALLSTHWPQSEAKKRFDELAPDTRLSDRLVPLMDCYVEAHKMSEKNPSLRKEQALQLLDEMELALIEGRNDDPSLKIWSDFRELSIAYLNEFYKRLDIHFDVWDAESYYVAEGRRLSQKFIDSGKTVLTSEGLNVIHDNEFGGYFVIGKSVSRSSLYLTRFVSIHFSKAKCVCLENWRRQLRERNVSMLTLTLMLWINLKLVISSICRLF